VACPIPSNLGPGIGVEHEGCTFNYLFPLFTPGPSYNCSIFYVSPSYNSSALMLFHVTLLCCSFILIWLLIHMAVALAASFRRCACLHSVKSCVESEGKSAFFSRNTCVPQMCSQKEKPNEQWFTCTSVSLMPA
jgi:hypothetical protein